MKAFKSFVVAGATATALIGAGYASAYNFELGAQFSQAEQGSDEGEILSLDAAAYFHPVDDSKGPKALANFLDRASGIMFTYTDVDIDGSDADFRDTALSARMVNKETGWTGELLFNQNREDLRGDTDVLRENTLGVGVGKYIAMNAEVGAFYTNTDETNTDSLGVYYRQVFVGDPTSLAVGLNVASVDQDGSSETGWGWEAGIYPTDNIGVAVTYDYDGFSEEDSWGVWGNYFVTPMIRLDVGFQKSGQLGDDDLEIGTIRTTFRF